MYPPHLDWLIDTGKKIKTACGRDVCVLELQHGDDIAILSAWAKHFRNQYCTDDMIDLLKGTKSRKEYLEKIKFPSETTAPGPSIRAGDFAEILLADYLEWRLKYWVPRLRWNAKTVANESLKGCDVMGFHFDKAGETSNQDILAIIESKASLSSKNSNSLQKSVDDSVKDNVRKAESLNYLKQRFVEKNQMADAKKIERFQSPDDNPYKQIFSAAAVFSTPCYDETSIQKTDTTNHPYHGHLKLIVVKGEDLMSLVHALYQRAADEA